MGLNKLDRSESDSASELENAAMAVYLLSSSSESPL